MKPFILIIIFTTTTIIIMQGNRSHDSNRNTLFTIGISLAALTAAAASYYVYYSKATKKNTPSSSSSVGSNDGASSKSNDASSSSVPTLTRDQLLTIMLEVVKQMEMLIAKFVHYEQEMVKQLAMRQQSIPDDVLKEHILDEFKKAMRITETQIYNSFGTNEAQVKEAAEFFVDDEDYKKIVNSLTLKFSMFARLESVEEVPAHITFDFVVEVLTETMERMTDSMERLFAQLEQTYTMGSEEFSQALQAGYAEKVQEIRTEVLSKHNITPVSHCFIFNCFLFLN